MSIDLKPFCGNEWEVRAALRAPWVQDGWLYATNGHVCVRLPAIEANSVGPRHPKNVSALFNKAFNVEGEFIAFPTLPCLVNCPVCGGSGSVEDEHGDTDCCFNCYGSGFDWTRQEVGDSGFNLLYMHQLSALPNARICTNGKKDAAAVLFDGGQAILMPMREMPMLEKRRQS